MKYVVTGRVKAHYIQGRVHPQENTFKLDITVLFAAWKHRVSKTKKEQVIRMIKICDIAVDVGYPIEG